MLRKVLFGFFLFYFMDNSCVKGHCDRMNASNSEHPRFEVRGIFRSTFLELSGKDEGSGKEEGDQGNELTEKCSKKFHASLKITNREPESCHDHLILVDHVYDPLRNESSPLLNPVVIRVKQERIVKVYDLQFLQLVNAEPKEVIKRQTSTSKKCKKLISCGSKLKNRKNSQSNFQGICCMCDRKKMQRHAKCGREACTHHQPGSSLHRECVHKALHSCLNEANYLQESPAPQPHVNNLNDGSCRDKRFCHTKLNQIRGDDIDNSEELSGKWSDEGYPVEGKESENLGLLRDIVDSFHDINNTFLGGENLGTKYLLGNNEIDLNTDIDDDEASIEFDEPGSVHVNSFQRGEGSSSGSLTENIDEEPGSESLEDSDSPSQDMDLDVEDEIMNGRLLELLENEGSSSDDPHSIDRRPKRVLSYPEEKVGDDTEFRSSRRNWNHEGSESNHNTGCQHGSSNNIIHCLKFSDLWYEVYQFSNVTYKHVVSLQVFEKNLDAGGTWVWIDATKGKPVRIISTNVAQNGWQRYKVLDLQDMQESLIPEIHRLLVPRITEGKSKKKHPEATDKPEKFLVLKEDLISTNGSECDKAGVSPETFVKQKARCTSNKGLCLKNQPSAIWRSDKVKSKKGHGKFLLSNFGSLPKNAYVVDEMSGSRTLSQDFKGTHVSQVDVVVPAGNNFIVRKGLPAQISAVVTDSTNPKHTVITASVINLGLASANFAVSFGTCYPNVIKKEMFMGPSNSSSNDSSSPKMVLITPMQKFDFNVTSNQQFERQITSCLVKVLNEKMHIRAVRRITIESGGRCICLWHCKCDCLKVLVNIKCEQMSQVEVKAAGLKGSVPSLIPLRPSGYLIVLDDENSSSTCAIFFLFGVLIVLVLLGLAKAILGATFWRSIWGWGLPYYCGPKHLCQYREAELKHREVRVDDEGYPVHPDTRKRTVQLYSRWTEFLLNILIFIVLPILAIFWWPICWCCSLCHRNVIGYRWIFSTKQKSDSSTESTSGKSVSDSLATSDTEDVLKECSEESPASKSASKSTVGSGKSFSSNKKNEELEAKNVSGNENVDRVDCEKSTLERNSKHSSSKSSSSGDRSHQLPENRSSQVVSKLPRSEENLPRYESRLSIEAYDGVADEQEADDVDYVLKQLRRSSTAIQKSQERVASCGGSLPNKVMSISARGEIVEDPEMSPRVETSSDDSVPGGMMMMKRSAEFERKDPMDDAVMDNQERVSSTPNQVGPQSSEMPNIASSEGLARSSNAVPADMEREE
ncbi:uncharacterized protein LOC124167903 isoform X2 [Ischnura elegans]|uniref:uncharacterized protein LOC124167903 isoform X2 n=1 Tax=Ischnura elegans TaxID=197161 RepID=UPI001ED8711A|nr:uncharacterized protein LOC124167903 isoform X2 [Ischnura elegans]